MKKKPDFFALHCWIADKVMGWKHVTSDAAVNSPGNRWIRYKEKCLVGTTTKVKLPQSKKPFYVLDFKRYEPTSDDTQALSVVARMANRGWNANIQTISDGQWCVCFSKAKGSLSAAATNSSLGMAICLAAEKAVTTARPKIKRAVEMA